MPLTLSQTTRGTGGVECKTLPLGKKQLDTPVNYYDVGTFLAYSDDILPCLGAV